MSPRLVLTPRLLLAVAGLAGCTPFKQDGGGDSDSAMGDAATVDSSASASTGAPRPCDPTTPFGPPVFTPGLTTAMASWMSGLRLSSDYLQAYFAAEGRSDSVGGVDLYTAVRPTADGALGNVRPLPGIGINTEEDESSPSVRGDGLAMVFERGPSGYSAPRHLCYANRTSVSAAFAYVGPLADVNGTNAHDQSPFVREDGQVLYFASDRASGAGGFDIYRAQWDGSTFRAPVPVSELDTSAEEATPVVTPDDRTIYFSSNRADADGSTSERIWVAHRDSVDAPFSAPAVVSEIRVPGEASPTFITRDQCVLHFAVYVVDAEYPFGSTVQYMAERPTR